MAMSKWVGEDSEVNKVRRIWLYKDGWVEMVR